MNTQGMAILGVGCVTPLGRDWETVWRKLQAGERPEREMLSAPEGGRPVGVYRTPLPEGTASSGGRLRRASAISHFACAAAADAVRMAGPLPAGRTALIFATSNGSVVYTRRFFEEVVARGGGSPLLFPETVYNAPTSHVAAMLGLDGAVLTLVGDAVVGMDALGTAADLFHSGAADCCVVVAAEELDWVSCEGYRRWKLAAPHRGSGIVLSEGAVAIVLGAGPDVRISRVHPGKVVPRSKGTSPLFSELLRELTCGETPELVVLSAAGGRPGLFEEVAVGKAFPEARFFSPKRVAGEAFAVSTLLQCLCAREELLQKRAESAVVPVLGWNGQLGGAFLSCG